MKTLIVIIGLSLPPTCSIESKVEPVVTTLEQPVSQDRYTGKYAWLTNRHDPYFKKWTHRYAPWDDYRRYKAQAMTESHLNAKAVSPAGASSLMQIMPGTWGDIEKGIWGGSKRNVFDPNNNIRGGIYYMSKLRKIWTAPRPEIDRWKLTLASYNAGVGNIIKAQKYCKGVNGYTGIIKCLPLVTGDNSKETIQYAPRTVEHYKYLMIR